MSDQKEMVSDLRRLLEKAKRCLEVARSQVRDGLSMVDKSESSKKHLEEAQTICRQVAVEIQEQAHRKIADIVSRSLEAVFDEPYTFKIIFEQKGGKTEARLVFEREGMQLDPMTSCGGGVLDVAAFALRLSCLLLSNPPKARVIIMDEPMRFVSKEYRQNVAALLQSLSKELNVQFIIITHQEEMRIGKVVEIK